MSIWSIMEVYINFCMLEKILKSFVFWDLCQNVLDQSDYRIFKSTISLEQDDEKSKYLHVDTDSLKLKGDWKI